MSYKHRFLTRDELLKEMQKIEEGESDGESIILEDFSEDEYLPEEILSNSV